MEQGLSYSQLLKLKKNPAYKLSEKQQALLAQYEAKMFKSNNKFAKHQTSVQEQPNEKYRK